MLLNYDANPFIQDIDNATPQQLASAAGNAGCCMLLEHAAATSKHHQQDDGVIDEAL